MREKETNKKYHDKHLLSLQWVHIQSDC